ncbi:MAG: CvpA family protein [Pseudomonadota bacterium]
MTIFDYLVLFVLAASVVIGLMRGLVKEVLALVGWVVAFVIANAYAAEFSNLMLDLITSDVLRMVVSFVALFIGVRVLIGLATLMIELLLKASGLGLIDRGLGAVFGLARGALMVVAAVMVASMTSMPQQPFWKDAVLSPVAESGVHLVKPFLPEALAKHVHI